MIRGATDLPLGKDASSRFLPWLIAFMVFLAALALTGALGLNSLIGSWRASATGTLTVHLPAEETAKIEDKKIDMVLGFLNSRAEVAHARAVPAGEVAAILEPWLGPETAADDLPLPRLIDVALLAGSRGVVPDLEARIKSIVPGASVEDHGQWLERFVRLARTIQWLAAAVLAAITFATIGTVVFTAQAGLATHRAVIEVLHLIGAEDSYIAREFGRHATIMAVKGGVFGIALAVPTILGIGYLAKSMGTVILPDLTPGIEQWLALLLLPVFVAVIARGTAWVTVHQALRRML